ncbi:intradiol ring-cleavage dioxygenase [Collimonas silvisoli]|uniref:intradiol ring-cleavage dioxygenase n=1 Tax=Collimonas silvisoli TaxID=2825884 RepID=UPI001B8C1F3C|nr:intradiol ring-cleavage dioxygenase [Collimonas silvisoli]
MRSTTRRHFVSQILGSALAMSWARVFGATIPATKNNLCTLTPEQEEGPFYIGGEALRSNLIEDRPGIPLVLRIQLIDAKHCVPLQNASIEVWSCDASGEYSGFSSVPFGGPDHMPPPGKPHGAPPPGMPPHHAPSNQKTFLRGIQRTNTEGRLEFTTLYPGCYEGRVNHIHIKVRVADASVQGGRVAHTGQIFLPEQVSKAVLALKPYSEHRTKRTSLEEDHVFTREHGDTMMASVTPIDPASIGAGYIATISFGVDTDATPSPKFRE